MAYRVAGRPNLETARPQGTADELFDGKIDIADLRPGVLSGLQRVARQLGVTANIFSAYRTDAYSEAVGGFAGDPHTRHIAADVNVRGTPIGNVPRAKRLLEDAGFISGAQANFYHGQPDPAHVQLRNEQGTQGNEAQATTLPQLWINAGGAPRLANIMAAIALAESGGRVDAVGGPNSDGSYDYGLWQINSSHGYNRTRLLSQPRYNAHAAVEIEHSQGLNAWTTYRTGAYRSHMGEQGPAIPAGPARRRPGGGNADVDQQASHNQEISWKDYLDPRKIDPFFGGPFLWLGNPLDLYRKTRDGISSTVTFLKWIAWIFHPRNILRIVEFLTGVGLFALGLQVSVKVFSEAGGPVVSGLGKLAEATPAGRTVGTAVKVRKAARQGRRQGRSDARAAKVAQARKAARRQAQTKESNREFNRKAKRTRADEIPF